MKVYEIIFTVSVLTLFWWFRSCLEVCALGLVFFKLASKPDIFDMFVTLCYCDEFYNSVKNDILTALPQFEGAKSLKSSCW